MNKWIDKAAKIREGEALDTEKLQSYLVENLPNFAAESQITIEQFPRGFSNLTYLIRFSEQEVVLRRPPLGAHIQSAHDMSREYKILSNLSKVYAKAPKPLLSCEDETVIGAPFYVMERVSGIILRPKMPEDMIPDSLKMANMADALIDTFVELHAVDYNAAVLSSLGRPQGYVQRQIEGWIKRYNNARTDDIENMEFAAKWLMENLPPDSGSSLIHNDFKYDNLVYDVGNVSNVIAVLDWEMATLGDPLMDLGTSLGYWFDADDPPELKEMQLSPTTIPGNPTRAAVAELYAQKSGRNIENIVFYYTYGLYKIAVIAQQIYARFQQGHTKDARFAQLIHAVRACALLASQAIRKKRIDRLFL